MGFFGRSYWHEYFDGLVEFGILTMPKDAELPEVAYSMPELQNTDGGIDVSEQQVFFDPATYGLLSQCLAAYRKQQREERD